MTSKYSKPDPAIVDCLGCGTKFEIKYKFLRFKVCPECSEASKDFTHEERELMINDGWSLHHVQDKRHSKGKPSRNHHCISIPEVWRKSRHALKEALLELEDKIITLAGGFGAPIRFDAAARCNLEHWNGASVLWLMLTPTKATNDIDWSRAEKVDVLVLDHLQTSLNRHLRTSIDDLVLRRALNGRRTLILTHCLEQIIKETDSTLSEALKSSPVAIYTKEDEAKPFNHSGSGHVQKDSLDGGGY